jgi:transcriptional regulator with XRE-family HTH domain
MKLDELKILKMRLKKIRKDNNFTQSQLADLLDKSNSSISDYENGKRRPSYEYLILFCKEFDVSLDYLFGLEDKIYKTETLKHYFREHKLNYEEAENIENLFSHIKKMLKN